MPLRALAFGLLLALGLPLGWSGCGPLQYIANVPMDAAGAVAEAQHLDAEKYAPYEITAAREYLHKSRELAGYARFHSSVTFGRKAATLAREAQKMCREKSVLAEAPTESSRAR